MRSIEQSFYHSRAWKDTAKLYMQKVSYMCERCKAQGKYNPARVVHHKIHLTKENVRDPSISLSFDNLEALCQDCHNKEHFGDKTPARYKIDENGDLIIL